MGTTMTSVQTGDSAYTDKTTAHVFDECRGAVHGSMYDMCQKNFAIGRDALICLEDGHYTISSSTIRNGTQEEHSDIIINGTAVAKGNVGTSNYSMAHTQITVKLKRGDYVQEKGWRYNSMSYSNFEIIRV